MKKIYIANIYIRLISMCYFLFIGLGFSSFYLISTNASIIKEMPIGVPETMMVLGLFSCFGLLSLRWFFREDRRAGKDKTAYNDLDRRVSNLEKA